MVSRSHTDYSRRLLRLNTVLMLVVLLSLTAVCGYLSTRYSFSADWTANGRHTLSAASRQVLANLQGPVEIAAFATDDQELRDAIRDLIAMFRAAKNDLTLVFIHPDSAPDQVRKLNVTSPGEMVLSYAGRSEHVTDRTEEALTNALQRLARGKEQWLAFVTGHGERDPFGTANHDYDKFAVQLQNRGFKTQSLNLATTPTIPDNTAVLIISSPEVAMLPSELTTIATYVDGGGNVLWLADPGPLHGLDPLAEKLEIAFHDGTIIDPGTRQYGVDQPTMVVVSDYGQEGAARNFKYVTLFPLARAVFSRPESKVWHVEPLLTTGAQAWEETGVLKGAVKFDQQTDIKGPLALGLTLTRDVQSMDKTKEPHKQRVVVLGDGDFISNKYLGNTGNLDFGLRLLNWLASDDRLLSLPARTSPDATLALSQNVGMGLWFGFQILLPVLLVVTGVYVWLSRRNA